MRKKLIAGNWKMNLNASQAGVMLTEFIEKPLAIDVDVLVIPPFTSIPKAYEVLKDTHIMLGAQNISEQSEGAYTGEISAEMLTDLNVTHVLIGHSERRTYQKESDELLNKKIRRALEANIVPVLCVGESKAERDENRAFDVVKGQIVNGLKDIENSGEIIIAYEPTWAIGTGDVCSPEDAQEMAKFIRTTVEELYAKEIAEKTRILYGGSVKPNNVTELMGREDIDGALVGGASLKADDFEKLVNFGE
ncbi:triosephosphate isomerase [Peptoniphilus asaccharolyticus DSM 20463]|uniref:Triosephosphate isomerase n=1 Tax=Peptoniphilus asaccharolyticus DSM 20463 TaxID=573058 RepID=A0A1W1VJI4_PEPAS|nr:triose-phosphate isomerase [Peptoniphilus asaccharolyticus]MBL7574397.1 triose-phosphate isomerase [Peptoniphilus asaccharolyticus]SMB93443.1 triosephosphate isomerase [Peptoniphilus asaccharolyticus DSM 20463]